MRRNRFEGHALVVHTFAHLERAAEDEENGTGSLGLMWTRLGDRLGMTDPVPDYGRTELPPLATLLQSPAGSGTRLLAARQCAGPAAAQAFAFLRHDVVGVTAALFPSPGASWGDLRSRWEASVLPLPAGIALGTTFVYRALDGGRAARRADRLARLLASVPPPTRFGSRWRRTPDGYLVLRSDPSEAGHGATQEAVVVGPAAQEDAFDSWTWHVHRTGVAAPFASYVEGAARLYHQASVHRTHRHDFRTACLRLSAASERLAALCGDVVAGGSGPGELLAAEAATAALYVGDQGLNQSLRDVREMRHSVRITLDRMVGILPPGPGPGGEVDGDQELGRGLIALLDDDIAHAESVKQEADEISRTTALVVQQRLHLHQQRTTVVQGAVVGALLMALAAIQALGYRPPLPGVLHAPLITWLSVLALLLPVQLLRWRRADGGDRRPNWFDRLSVFAVGAATGWLGASVGAFALTGAAALPLVSVGCASAFGGAALLADRMQAAHGD
ncbi:CATRA conflict system CASPASE/TPR repeat-associated protein [Streptomyces sp. NPDC006430]|uniref:CATRA conflict system CASPASE/TPR repeat-associated protein n=1 Tax=Streptomyces sp. NPDC006430 TaxID=3154299 RepID=UPI0033A765F8